MSEPSDVRCSDVEPSDKILDIEPSDVIKKIKQQSQPNITQFCCITGLLPSNCVICVHVLYFLVMLLVKSTTSYIINTRNTGF